MATIGPFSVLTASLLTEVLLMFLSSSSDIIRLNKFHKHSAFSAKFPFLLSNISCKYNILILLSSSYSNKISLNIVFIVVVLVYFMLRCISHVQSPPVISLCRQKKNGNTSVQTFKRFGVILVFIFRPFDLSFQDFVICYFCTF